MEFTTQLALHSQATRLGGSLPSAVRMEMDGVVTLFDPAFQPSYPHSFHWQKASRLQFGVDTDLQVELVPFHSPLLGESLLVSFPPLSYMLKFSG